MDTDGDGNLDIDEFKKGMHREGYCLYLMRCGSLRCGS